MKFSSNAGEMTRALRAIARKHPTNRSRGVNMQITASADGVWFETNLSSAFVAAQVAVAGISIAPRNTFTRVLATFPQRRPITIEVTDGYLHIGSFKLDLGELFRPQKHPRIGSD